MLANPEELDENGVAEQLATRARLLQDVIELGDVSKSESAELIKRSRQLKEAAEQTQRKLGEKLKAMHKGRRSVQAYQTVKRS
ncbi:hypothetical protein MBH78_12245 [Oceanimonas sp. NS1]|nr:hypothetical protein [Oceanimonas sp. NS1]